MGYLLLRCVGQLLCFMHGIPSAKVCWTVTLFYIPGIPPAQLGWSVILCIMSEISPAQLCWSVTLFYAWDISSSGAVPLYYTRESCILRKEVILKSELNINEYFHISVNLYIFVYRRIH